MHLREALNQIAEIRQRMAESELFRGYRALPVAASGLFALVAGALQPVFLPDAEGDVRAFVLFWTGVATLSVLAAGLTMWMRDCFAGPSHTRSLTWLAIRQFVPSLSSGIIVAAVIVRASPESGWLLPGLWSMFFGQGVFASCRALPRPVYIVSAYYLTAGAATLFASSADRSMSGWTMAMTFGIGQLLAALVLYVTLERRHDIEQQ